MEEIKIFQLAERYHKLFPKKDMLAIQKNGILKTYSTEDYIETTNNIAYGLIEMGIKKNDKICIISSNRPEWSLVDMGINKIGAINAPIYPNITRTEYKYIIEDCGAKIIFVGSKEIYNRVKGLNEEIECLQEIYSFDQIENIKNWRDIIQMGIKEPQIDTLLSIQNSIKKK